MSEKAKQRIYITLGVVSLFADLGALAQLAYSSVIEGQTSNFVFQLIGVTLFFLFGLGLGMLGTKGEKNDSLENILKIFVWAYLLIACFTYLGIIIQFRQPYSLSSYVIYLVVLAIQVLAFSILKSASQIKDAISYAFAFLIMAVLHGLIWLFYLVSARNQEPMQIIGEIGFWFIWTLYAIPAIQKGTKSKKRKSRFLQD